MRGVSYGGDSVAEIEGSDMNDWLLLVGVTKAPANETALGGAPAAAPNTFGHEAEDGWLTALRSVPA